MVLNLNFAITSSGPNSNTILEVWVRVFTEELSGCTDINASNYNDLATIDNGSCTYEVTFQVDLSCSSISPNSVTVTTIGHVMVGSVLVKSFWKGTSYMQEGVLCLDRRNICLCSIIWRLELYA